MSSSPFLTFAELLRGLAKVFDLKANDKKLDDKARDIHIDINFVQHQINTLCDQVIDLLDTSLVNYVSKQLLNALDHYRLIVATHDVSGLNRYQVNKLMSKHCFGDQFAVALQEFCQQLNGPNPILLASYDTNAVSNIISWLDQYDKNWNEFIANLNKEKKAILTNWKNGKKIPSIISLKTLSNWPETETKTTLNLHRAQSLLFIAMCIERAKRDYEIKALFAHSLSVLWGSSIKGSLEEDILLLQQPLHQQYPDFFKLCGKIAVELRRTTCKSTTQQTELKSVIERLKIIKQDLPIGYFIDWHQARWSVYSGDLTSAKTLYLKAFEGALFQSGEHLKDIINESFIVASSQPKPDKVFLKKLKMAVISHGFDISSVSTETPSNKTEDWIQDWEIENWKSSFQMIFPKKGWFPNVEIHTPESKIGPLIYDEATVKSIKPDLRNPNRRITTDIKGIKRWPQLVWFIAVENEAAVANLLEAGASVDVETSSGDTPLLLAIQAMCVCDERGKKPNSAFFKMLETKGHSAKTVNQATQKLKLTPLTLAVDTGQFDVVKKILEMGADVNVRGHTDEQTALNICIKRIGMLKNPEKSIKEQLNMAITPEVLDSVRRHNPGVVGFDLEHIQKFVFSERHNPRYRKIEKAITELYTQNIHNNLSLSEMRKIAKFLINNGADVNAKHTSPVSGYTPLMLAAEFDEEELFNSMLIHGGDPKMTYFCQNTTMNVDCWEIAREFRAPKILQILNDIEVYIN